jgi:SAM-dependent methyltransferase
LLVKEEIPVFLQKEKVMRQLFRIIDTRRDVRETLQNYFSKHLKSHMNLYDIGCGNKPFAEFLKDKVSTHIGVDIDDGFYDSSHIDLVGSAYEVPAEDNAADALVSSQVIEHLNRPIDAIQEMARLLKPQGLLFLSFPFLYPIHAAPHDYMRYTEHYVNDVLGMHGFEIIEKSRIGGFWYCLGMYTGVYLQNFDRGILEKIKIIKVISIISRWGFNIIHLLEGLTLKAFKKDADLFRAQWTVNYTYVARKKS